MRAARHVRSRVVNLPADFYGGGAAREIPAVLQPRYLQKTSLLRCLILAGFLTSALARLGTRSAGAVCRAAEEVHAS